MFIIFPSYSSAKYDLIQYALHVRKKRKLPNTFSEAAAGVMQYYDIGFYKHIVFDQRN